MAISDGCDFSNLPTRPINVLPSLSCAPPGNGIKKRGSPPPLGPPATLSMASCLFGPQVLGTLWSWLPLHFVPPAYTPPLYVCASLFGVLLGGVSGGVKGLLEIEITKTCNSHRRKIIGHSSGKVQAANLERSREII